MTREEYIQLFEKFMAGKATPAEIELLLSHQDDFELAENDTEAEKGAFADIREQIISRLDLSVKDSYPQKRHWSVFWAAASVTLLTVLASFFFFKSKTQYTLIAARKGLTNQDVKPAPNNTTLTLANGKTVVLNHLKAGSFFQQGSIRVKKRANGSLEINALANNNSRHADNEVNTISTPIGGHYEVVLPDGSKVWLNALTTLKFPSVFTHNERKVELMGEAYFEIVKNKEMPFKVQFNNSLVKVLGTHFNIMAYQDEAQSTTTLLEGSVAISKNSMQKMLLPGQQAVIVPSRQQIDISPAEAGAVAWKDNLFLFHDDNIKSIMRQLARWYDIDVAYQTNTAHKEYGIRMSKSKNLSEILKNLELTGTIHFKIDGRRVVVME